MNNQVDGLIKKKRVKEVLEISEEGELEFYKKYIGKTLEGVTELRKDGTVIVHTSNFIPVKIENCSSNNEIVKVKILNINDAEEVIGEIV